MGMGITAVSREHLQTRGLELARQRIKDGNSERNPKEKTKGKEETTNLPSSTVYIIKNPPHHPLNLPGEKQPIRAAKKNNHFEAELCPGGVCVGRGGGEMI